MFPVCCIYTPFEYEREGYNVMVERPFKNSGKRFVVRAVVRIFKHLAVSGIAEPDRLRQQAEGLRRYEIR